MRTDPLRIGLVCPYSLTVPGGVQGQVLGLARVLRQMGHEARVLGPCDGPPPATFVTPLGNSIPTAANGSIVPLAPDPSCALRTIRALRDEDFDVVHVHEPMAPGPTQTTLLLDLAPAVATFHAAGYVSTYKQVNKGVRWLAERIDVRCAVSKDAEAMAERWLGGTYEMLYNGVELDRYVRIDPYKADGPTVFFCGRHEERKGLGVLLEAMAQLPPSVRLWIGSSGPETDRLRRQYAGDTRIEWLGRISEEEKIARMAGASVFCAPSLHGESFGVVLIEAMAAGTPVVATALDGYKNAARPDVDALLVPPGDATALADAIRRILADEDLANALRSSGVERATQFSMESLAERYLEIYRLAIAMPRWAEGGSARQSAGGIADGRMMRQATRLGRRAMFRLCTGSNRR
jgi:phosphatidyl-myo-inositol alpha-mannosyltransferase